MGYNDYASLLQVCSNTKSLIMGKQVHSHMLITGQEKSIFLAAKFLTLYSSCGCLKDERQVFDKLCEPNASQALDQVHNSNVFLWNAMIKGYAEGGACEEALGLYYQMREAGMQPDNFTFTLVLKVCVVQSALQEGMEIHDDIMRAGIELDDFVGTALLDMYVKCSSVEVARKLFDKLPHRDRVSWNAMIVGYAQNGFVEEALKFFGDMRMAGVKPNPVTMVSVISACALLGVLQQGIRIHSYMIRSGFEFDVFVGDALIDMYAKCGSVEVTCKLFDKMSKKDVIWGALLGACKIHSNIELGKFISKHPLELEPKKVGNYVLISNIYAAAGRWDDVTKVRSMLKERGLKKIPGSSWIEIKNRVHSFSVGDKSHPR